MLTAGIGSFIDWNILAVFGITFSVFAHLAVTLFWSIFTDFGGLVHFEKLAIL